MHDNDIKRQVKLLNHEVNRLREKPLISALLKSENSFSQLFPANVYLPVVEQTHSSLISKAFALATTPLEFYITSLGISVFAHVKLLILSGHLMLSLETTCFLCSTI